MTTIISDSQVTALKSLRPVRSYQQLSRHDMPKITAFFLSFDFDMRRSYFGGGISDHSIMQYCRTIDWTTTDMIGRSGRYCLEALATIVAMPPDNTRAELALACPLFCDQRQIVAELMSNVVEFASAKYRRLVVWRDLAHPDLIAELRSSELAAFSGEEIEVKLCPTAGS